MSKSNIFERQYESMALTVIHRPFRTMDKKKLKDIFDVAIFSHGFAFYNRDDDFSIEMDSAETATPAKVNPN